MESLIKPIAIFLISLMLTFSLSWFNFSRTSATPAPPTSTSNLNPPITTSPIPPVPVSADKLTPAFQSAQDFFNKGEYEAAISQWKAAIAFYKKSSDRLNQAATLNNLALTHQKLNQWTQAQTTIKESLNLITPPKPSSNTKANPTQITIYAQALDIQANIYFNQGRTQEALNHWQTTEKIYTQLKDRGQLKDQDKGQLYSQFNQAQALYTIGFLTQSYKILEKLEKDIALEPVFVKIQILSSLSKYYQSIGELDKAESAIDNAATASEQLEPEHKKQEQPSIYLFRANIKRSIAERERDIELAADYQVNPSYKTYLPQLNIAQVESKSIKRGITEPIQRIKKDAYTEAWKALVAYQDVINLFQLEDSNNSLIPVQAQINLLSLYRELNQEPEALKLFSQVDDRLNQIEKQGGISHDTIYARIKLVKTVEFFAIANRRLIDQILDIKAQLRTAYKNAEKIQDVKSESYALGMLGRWYELNDKLPEAQEQTQQALQVARSINASDIVYLWQWQLGRVLRDRNEPAKAITSYEGATQTLKAVRSSLATANPDVQFSFRDNIEPIYRELVELLLNTPNQSENIQKFFKDAIRYVDELQLVELENFFRCNLGAAKKIQLNQTPDPHVASFHIILLSDRVDVLLKLPNQENLLRYSSKMKRIDLEQKLKLMREKLREAASGDDVQQVSKIIYEALMKEAESALKSADITTLVFVLDGNLRDIPMAALYDGKQYLIEKYALAVTPGMELLGRKQNNVRPSGALIAASEAGGVVNAGGGEFVFSAIPGVIQEIKEIKSSFPDSRILINQEFTENQFRKEVASSRYPILHIATHGRFSSDPQQTFILMYSSKPGDSLKQSIDPNLLQAVNLNQLQEILRTKNKNSPIELLVFSACETASGDRRATLGLAGIAIRAGAFGTLGSLWKVDDQATAKLMGEFYRALTDRNAPVSKAEALRKAQLSLLRSNQPAQVISNRSSKDDDFQVSTTKDFNTPPLESHPRYWASFVLVGNWL
jgi:CHAT domain-containing protein